MARWAGNAYDLSVNLHHTTRKIVSLASYPAVLPKRFVHSPLAGCAFMSASFLLLVKNVGQLVTVCSEKEPFKKGAAQGKVTHTTPSTREAAYGSSL